MTDRPIRHPNWHGRLLDWLIAAAPQPFVPGTHDCALFAAGAVAAMTGIDPAARWRGRYSTIAEGAALLRRDGYADHVAVAAELFKAVHPSQAMVGDLAVLDDDTGRPALGVVQGGSIYVLHPVAGLNVVGLLTARGAYRV